MNKDQRMEEEIVSEKQRTKDMMNFQIKELRTPKYNEGPHATGKPCENFNRYFTANGTMVALKTLEEQKVGIAKMYIDDLKRKPLGYETAFEGGQYHLVRNRETSQYNIQMNHLIPGDPL